MDQYKGFFKLLTDNYFVEWNENEIFTKHD